MTQPLYGYEQHVREQAKDIRRRVQHRWGRGWSLLSEREQHNELAHEFVLVVLAQMDESEIKGLAKALFSQL